MFVRLGEIRSLAREVRYYYYYYYYYWANSPQNFVQVPKTVRAKPEPYRVRALNARNQSMRAFSLVKSCHGCSILICIGQPSEGLRGWAGGSRATCIYSPRIPRALTPKDSSSISYIPKYMSIRPISDRLPTVPSQIAKTDQVNMELSNSTAPLVENT
jgi:hypothetical protein